MLISPSRIARALPAALLLLLAAVAPSFARRLDVEVWTDRGNDAVYEPGDPMRVKVRTTEDAYLLVYELDAEGHVNLLYPWNRGSGRVEAKRTLRLPDESSDYQLVVEKQTGQGFIVAIASDRPFRDLPWYLRPFDPQAAAIGYEDPRDSDDDGDRQGLAKDDDGFDDQGRVMGDPYVAMERIRRRVMDRPADLETFSSAYATYYVHEQVRYPRYLCNDCHRPNRWAWWEGFDPYYANCSVIDFRVNWGWAWGPQCWSSHTPYYYYVVRSDCPPRYQPWYDNRTRLSSWDGWNRWGELWGGQLRRYKATPAPVSYVPPPPRGQVWRQGQTPPGFVPPDVRRQGGTPGSGQSGWLGRDRGDGKPVWREGPRVRPDGSGGSGSGSGGRSRGDGDRPAWRDGGGSRSGDTPPSREGRGGSSDEPRPTWRGGGGSGSGGSSDQTPRPSWRGGDRPRQDPPPANETPRERPRQDPPRQDPPRQQDPPRVNPPRQDPPRDNPPNWRQPPPPSPKPEPARGQGGKGKG